MLLTDVPSRKHYKKERIKKKRLSDKQINVMA
jgi:hypothetical protein